MTFKTCPQVADNLFLQHFSHLHDPRRTNKGNHQHLLSDIILLTISAMISGATEWSLVRTFGKNQLLWLKRFGNFNSGIPSEDTLERVFAALDSIAFNQCFMDWIKDIRKEIKGEVIAIDGKTMCGAKAKKGENNMPHIVSAFAAENGLCLGQVKTKKKSNEITAIPELLDLLALKGCTVTIDAMGCQSEIASKITAKEADYILAVKGNQGALKEAIKDTVLLEKPNSVDIWADTGHGRIETRTCKAYNNLSHLEEPQKWKKLSCFFIVESEVFEKSSGKSRRETRYYITSLLPKADILNKKTREHWAVENNLHWTLDVTLGEDASRKRKGNSAQNFNIMLKSVMTLLSNDKTPKFSKKRKMLSAALDSEYREKILDF